jgi:pimeloyl-ACP methyl ester carboxylesterase
MIRGDEIMAIAQSTSTQTSSTEHSIGGVIHNYRWTWEGQPLTVVYETLGEGKPVLLLPAFSTVSTREELRGIAQRLSSQFQAIALDWPGFGQSERLPLDYRAELYRQFLHDFVRDILDCPTAVVAAGHAVGYVMQLAQQMPQSFSKIVLVAPTWRGPLPTMGANQQLSGLVRELVRSPFFGEVLYQMNTTPSFLRLMYGRHVYVNDVKLTPEFIAHKREITQQEGARYAPAAFVTGAIDPVQERDEFLAYFQPLPVPVMVIIGEQVPSKSREEMNAIAALPDVQSTVLPGSLGMYEECAEAVAEVILQFL